MGKYSTSLVAEFSIIYDGKELKKPRVLRNRLLRKKFKKHYLSSNQKLASTQTLGSAFLDRIPKNQNSKYEPDLFRLLDFFIGGYGSVNSERVNFSIDFDYFFKKNLVKVVFISIQMMFND